MVNRNYLNGKAKEQRVKNKYKKMGFDIVIRSAGSKSPIDLVAINSKEKIIRLIQCKPKNFPAKKREKLLGEFNYLNRDFRVGFDVE